MRDEVENLQRTIARLQHDWCVGQKYDGSLRILPLPRASGANWRQALWGGPNDVLEQRLAQYVGRLGHAELRLWLFDFFSEYAMANLEVEPERATVLYGTAHGADLDGSRPSTIEAYLDAIVASYLSVEARHEMFSLGLGGDSTRRFEGPHANVDLDAGSHALG
ncbi:MAG: hypothetical protein H6721_29080 [Sandaracinus sp.]|nr:hypothetical protein [Sandaracinus sp.]